MTTAPSSPTAADRMCHLQGMLTNAAGLGDRLLRVTVEQAEASTLPVEKAAIAYERVTRSMRRSTWLIRKLDEPAKTTDRTAARKQVIRVVEDIIQRHAEDPEEAEMLHEELRERLDTMDFEDEIRGRPIDDIITDIVRDLGLAAVPGNHPWKRRTPDDLAELCALAAQPIPAAARTIAGAPPQTQASLAWPNQTPAACNSS